MEEEKQLPLGIMCVWINAFHVESFVKVFIILYFESANKKKYHRFCFTKHNEKLRRRKKSRHSVEFIEEEKHFG